MSNPFENIAISLSGGGYRAAAFHLGALSYLDHLQYKDKPMLHQVKVISTISGGTFTGVSYVLALAQGKNFSFCFHKLYRLLQEDKLVLEAMQMVNKTKTWKAQAKNKNLINAFSEIYQEKYCDNEHIGLLLENDLGHLEEFCFNASDLYHTVPFRFQKRGDFGNGEVELSHQAAAEIRLGDVMAASSCFPGGFEPLAFPRDFIREIGSPLYEYWEGKMKEKRSYPSEIALMDGGILDNQGIESVEKSNERRRKLHAEIGTFIISDVSSRNPAPFKFPAPGNMGLLGALTYQSLVALLVFITSIGVFGTWWFWNESQVWLILSVLLSTFSGLFLFGIYMIQKFLDTAVVGTIDQQSETPAILSHLKILEKTPIHILKNLVLTRLFSLSDILGDTFMARIRKIQFNNIYSHSWRDRLISNNIYSLFTDYKTATVLNPKKHLIPAPSDQMLSTTKKAASMGTSLWFTSKEKKDNNMLNTLIVAGQINLCFQLLRYFEDEQDKFPPDMQPSLNALKDRVLDDYKKFVAGDEWLLKSIRAMV